MQEVLSLIEKKKHELEQLPLLKFMANDEIEPLQRLAWVPCLAPFAMNFGDLNKYVLRQELTTNKIQQIINIHTYEDDHHWIWFLEDIKKLGLDHSIPFSDSLRFMWSNETHKTRLMFYKIGLLYTLNTEPILRLCISLAIEATGHVILYRTAQIAKMLTEHSKLKYRYFGYSHFDVETGHPMGTENVEDFIHTYEAVFAAFTEMFHEWMEYVNNYTLEQPYIKRVHKSREFSISSNKPHTIQEMLVMGRE
jgi:hypothetical protein